MDRTQIRSCRPCVHFRVQLTQLHMPFEVFFLLRQTTVFADGCHGELRRSEGECLHEESRIAILLRATQGSAVGSHRYRRTQTLLRGAPAEEHYSFERVASRRV